MKIAPDLDRPKIESIAATLLRHAHRRRDRDQHDRDARRRRRACRTSTRPGGLSGAPLTARATTVARQLAQALGRKAAGHRRGRHHERRRRARARSPRARASSSSTPASSIAAPRWSANASRRCARKMTAAVARQGPAGGRHRREGLHRLHAVHPGLPGGCHRRRGEAHAHGDRRGMHRLQAVPAALSRGLHRDGRERGNLDARGAPASAPASTGGATEREWNGSNASGAPAGTRLPAAEAGDDRA